jgi:hypothetical protein
VIGAENVGGTVDQETWSPLPGFLAGALAAGTGLAAALGADFGMAEI